MTPHEQEEMTQEEIIFFEPKEKDWDYEYISDEGFLIEEILGDRINADNDRMIPVMNLILGNQPLNFI